MGSILSSCTNEKWLYVLTLIYLYSKPITFKTKKEVLILVILIFKLYHDKFINLAKSMFLNKKLLVTNMLQCRKSSEDNIKVAYSSYKEKPGKLYWRKETLGKWFIGMEINNIVTDFKRTTLKPLNYDQKNVSNLNCRKSAVTSNIQNTVRKGNTYNPSLQHAQNSQFEINR